MRSISRAASAPSENHLYLFIRQVVDIVFGTLLLILLLPVLLTVAVAVYADSGAPILYRCQRVGKDGRPIKVLKFRTMRDGSHHHLEALLSVDEERRLEYTANRKIRNDPRRTRVGPFLRRSSLDELPQLLNVIAGEMSLIGPRPYFADELVGRREARELLMVKPGITGLWQVSGRSDRTFEERIALEVDYVRKRGFSLDTMIAIQTVRAVLSGRGAY
ncbi:MAG: sugar transferase [Chloroflexota bacterium]|nr:sugar transferase [Chloroflexota bacterium]